MWYNNVRITTIIRFKIFVCFKIAFYEFRLIKVVLAVKFLLTGGDFMFELNEVVIHKSAGACVVCDIVTRNFGTGDVN